MTNRSVITRATFGTFDTDRHVGIPYAAVPDTCGIPAGVWSRIFLFDGGGLTDTLGGASTSRGAGVAGTPQAWGLQFTDNAGAAYNVTGLNWTAAGSAIIGLRSTVAQNDAHHNFWLHSGATKPSGVTLPTYTTVDPFLPSGVDQSNTHALATGGDVTSAANRLTIDPRDASPFQQDNLLAFTWDAATGHARLMTLYGYKDWSGGDGHWEDIVGSLLTFGPFSCGFGDATGNMYCFLHATAALDDTTLFRTMRALAEFKYRDASIVFQGYAPPSVR